MAAAGTPAAADEVSEAHLTPAVLKRFGPPDLRLRLGGRVFPVHKAFVSAASPVLAGLAADCAPLGELLLAGDAGEGPAAQAPAAVKSPSCFQRFLQLAEAGWGMP